MTVHETAIIGVNTSIGPDAYIGPYCVLGDGNPNGLPLTIGRGAVIRSHSVAYYDVHLGDRVAFGHAVLVREHTTIGDDVSIGSHSVIEHSVSIGNRVRLHSACFVPEHTVIKDDAWLGPGVCLTNARYPGGEDTKSHLEPVVVERGAIIGARVTIMPGVHVGENALVGAAALVLRDVEARSVVIGAPAKPIRR